MLLLDPLRFEIPLDRYPVKLQVGRPFHCFTRNLAIVGCGGVRTSSCNRGMGDGKGDLVPLQLGVLNGPLENLLLAVDIAEPVDGACQFSIFQFQL